MENGKYTLEMTPGGRYLDALKLFDRYSTKNAILPWKKLSARFANEASGTVSIFANMPRLTSIFSSIELPILETNPNVSAIVYKLSGENKAAFNFQ